MPDDYREPETQRLPAVCWAVIDCGLQDWWWEHHVRRTHEIRLGFELLEERDRAGDRRLFQRRYNFTLHKRSALRQDLERWIGPLPVPFDLAALLGQGAVLTVERQTSGFRRIAAIAALHGPLWPPQRRPLHLRLDPQRFDPEALTRLPGALRDHIMASPTFLALHGEPIDPPEHTRPATAAELIGDEIPW